MYKYFKGINNFNDLRITYKKLALKNHPDFGGNTAIMQEINAEYDELFLILKNNYNNDDKNKDSQMTETPEAYREVVIKVIKLKGVTVELCGSWIWLSGNTKEYKDEIKAAGFYWAAKKKMWYWRPEVFKSFNRKPRSMDYIRNKYGSEKLTVTEKITIAN